MGSKTHTHTQKKKETKQFEIADNPADRVLKVAAGRIMKRTLLSGDKSVCGGV